MSVIIGCDDNVCNNLPAGPGIRRFELTTADEGAIMAVTEVLRLETVLLMVLLPAVIPCAVALPPVIPLKQKFETISDDFNSGVERPSEKGAGCGGDFEDDVIGFINAIPLCG